MSSKYFIKIVVLLGFTLNTNSMAQTFHYYPLEIGNYWEYFDWSHQWTSQVYIVKDTVMSNGKSYAYSGQGRYQRFENDCVYFYDSRHEQENLVFFFSAVPHTKINTFLRGEDTVDVYHSQQETVFGGSYYILIQ